MKPLSEVFAKSANYGNLSLLHHTQQVAEAILKFAEGFNYNFDKELAWKAAILHDLGKAHPHFQHKIQSLKEASLAKSRKWDYIHRHEISSLAFLPLFPKNEWDILINLVVAHHKSIKEDAGLKGILDLEENCEEWLEDHLKEWHDWQAYGLEILQTFKFPIRSITEAEAKQALNYAVEYCRGKKAGWSPLRGLLKSADHFASAFMHETSEKLKHLFEKPDLSYFHQANRQSELYPLSQISTTDKRQHTLVVAPTGAGKTDFLLRRCLGRVFYTLPFQASINAMYERVKEAVHPFQPDADIRLLHATSKIVVKNRLDEQVLQPLPGSSIKILTPHQLAAMVFGTSGFESVMLDVKGTDVILDEIHTYSDYSRSMVLEIVKVLKWLDCRIHIGTATMPSVLYQELLTILGGTENVYEVKLENNILDLFDRHAVYKLEDETEIPDILTKAFAANEKVLVIYNTVQSAQDAFQEFSRLFPEIDKMLIHSRFRRGDRVDLETKLKQEFNGDGKKFGNGLCPCLVVSTQVVEVSLDISFDRMITKCAPLDGMIQRFGRVNRKRTADTIGKYKPVHVMKPQGNVLPYKKEILEASYAQLPKNGEILKERTLQAKIDAVYPTLDKKEIDVHVRFKEGKFILRELTDYKKSVMIEALEIASATCILQDDLEKYETAIWEERLHLEIPVAWKTIVKQKTKYMQLEIGARPFVIPQQLKDYELLGLQLVEHESIW